MIGALSAGEKEMTFVYIPPNLSEPWHVATRLAGEYFAEDLGIKLIVLDPGNDPSMQIKMAHDIAPQVDGAIIIPVSSEAYRMAEEFKKAKADMPVICVDRDAPTEAIDLYIAFDNKEAGKMVARKVVEILTKKFGQPKGQVVLVTGDLSSPPAAERREGNYDVLNQHPKIKVVAEVEAIKWTTESAQSQLMALMETFDKPPDAIISSMIPTPSVNALRGKGWLKRAEDPDHVIIGTMGASSEALKNVKDGHVDFVMSQPNMFYVPMGIYYCKKILEEGFDILPKPADTVAETDIPISSMASLHKGVDPWKEAFWSPGKVIHNPQMKHNQLLIKGGIAYAENADEPYWWGNVLPIWHK